MVLGINIKENNLTVNKEYFPIDGLKNPIISLNYTLFFSLYNFLELA